MFDNIMYPKGIFLISSSIIVLIWLLYFCLSLKKILLLKGKDNKKIINMQWRIFFTLFIHQDYSYGF